MIGGGTDNIAFLKPNADAVQMTATFWIETIEHSIIIGPHAPNQPLHIAPPQLRHRPRRAPGADVHAHAASGIAAGHVLKVRSTQIQYTQTVFLNFNGLRWPHVSVSTLVPAGPDRRTLV